MPKPRIEPRRGSRSFVRLVALSSIIAVGAGAAYGWMTSPPSDDEVATFGICGSGARETRVADGDTFWLRGEKIRLSDVDAPETSEPKCASERALGERAKHRLTALLNMWPFGLERGLRDEDRFVRKVRTVYRDGQSIGELLVIEGLAWNWTGRREPWC